MFCSGLGMENWQTLPRVSGASGTATSGVISRISIWSLFQAPTPHSESPSVTVGLFVWHHPPTGVQVSKKLQSEWIKDSTTHISALRFIFWTPMTEYNIRHKLYLPTIPSGFELIESVSGTGGRTWNVIGRLIITFTQTACSNYSLGASCCLLRTSAVD